jgi:putative hydroxymethylpyrimidine transport system permease protein
MTASRFASTLRAFTTVAVLIVVWQLVVEATGAPRYILPAPLAVAQTLLAMRGLLFNHALVTLTELILGGALGVGLGVAFALTLALFRPARRWLLPVLVMTQAVPVFALAPIMVLWFGYGLASKVATAALIVFFPVTSAFYDGLRRIEPGWLDLARTMGANGARTLWRIRVPAALPALGSGVRVAAAVAPIGAVIGEWVGASEGLGYLMLQANGRMQTDLMFAALAVLAIMAIAAYAATDRLVRWIAPWASPSGDTASQHR